MNTVNDDNSQNDSNQAFLPQQLEQDYLSCLLGVDDKPEEILSNHSDGIENADQNTSMMKSSLENESVDRHDGLRESASGDPVDEEEIDTNNAAANNIASTVQYMSVDALSASAPFVCQLMLIAGVKFAVPLANFSRVIAVPDNIKLNSNAASACFGKFEWQGQSMFLLALKRIMQPDKTAQDTVLNASDKIVLIEQGDFGFVCNQMMETVTISPEDVLWRDESSQRYWLAGMVKEAGFAILDVKGILHSATNN